MKVLHVYNTANDGYHIALKLREFGIDAHLVLDETHPITALPHWEEGDMQTDDINDQSAIKIWEAPEWIHYIEGKKDPIYRTLKLFRMFRNFDIIQAYAPSPIYLQFQKKPYVLYECGWMRKFPLLMDKVCRLGRRGYAKGKYVIMTNPDLYSMYLRMNFLPPTVFIPFAIDTNRYPYVPPTKNPEVLCYLSPSRLIWDIKGQDKLIKAWKIYTSATDLNVKMYIVKWGKDADKTVNLVNDLGLQDTIEFISLMSKPKLIKAYHAADIVCDQFILGSYGTAAPEAMACGVPVLMYLNEYYNTLCYGRMPPIANAHSIEDIVAEMEKLEDFNYRKRLSEDGLSWIKKEHSPDMVAMRHIKLYEGILDERS